MATFFDDFNRANGAPGGNWTATASTQISGQAMTTGATAGAAWNTSVVDADYTEVTCNYYHANGIYTYHGGPAVRAGTGTSCIWFGIKGTAAPWTFVIAQNANTSPTELASASFSGTPPGYYTLKLVHDHGELIGYYNGNEVIRVSSGYAGGGAYGGLVVYNGMGSCADILIVATTALGLTVTPAIVGNYGACVEVALTGTGTSWTPGTPGSPVFTVNHGSISAQTVLTESTATATYCPGDYLGAVVFTDPSTGQTATIMVTSDPGIVTPPGTGDTWYPYRVLVQHTGEYGTPNTMITDQTVIIPNGSVDGLTGTWPDWDQGSPWPPVNIGFNDALRNIYAAVVLQQAVAPVAGTNLSPLVERLQNLSLWLTGGVDPSFGTHLGASQTTIKEDLATILGEGTASLSGISDLISALLPVDLSSVLDAIAALRGDTTTTVAELLTVLGQIRTLSTYTLGDVISAVDDVRGEGMPTLKTIRDDIAALSPGGTTDLSGVLSAIAGNRAVTDAIRTLLLAYLSPEGATVQTILDAIGDISVSAPPSVPLWPGAANATLGISHTLTDGLTITAPMDGVIVTITGTPPNPGKYTFGSVRSWMRAGAVVFGDGEGRYERAESYGLDAQIIVPKTMIRAGEAIFRRNAGFTGTARSWTANG